MPGEGRCGVCVEPGEGQKSSEIMEGSCNVLSDQGVNRVGKMCLRSRKPFGVFWDKKCKGCRQARKKKCNARMPIVLPTLVWSVCAETIALKTDASIIWEPPATCYQPPRISPHETGGLETLPTPHIGQGSLKAY